jgi:hypothetical protein
MNKINFLMDAGTFLAFLVAMEPRFSGITIHEWLSVALAAAIVVHLLLHWKWIVSVGARFFRKLWHTSRLKFVVDALLFVAFVAVMMSGIMISRAILPALGLSIQPGMAWRSLHSLSADASILLLGLHFALSWGWIWERLQQYLLAPLGKIFKLTPRQPSSSAPDEA